MVLGQGAKLGWTCVDVGASGGFGEFPGLEPRITLIGFEPDKTRYRELADRIYPKGGWRSARAENLALAEAQGDFCFYLTANPQMNSLLAPDLERFRLLFGYAPGSQFWQDQIALAGVATASATTLDDYCKDHAVQWIDYLKLDAQGVETRILRGADRLLKENCIAIIKTEVTLLTIYQGQDSFADTDGLLRNHGYELLDCDFYPGSVREEGPSALPAPPGLREKTRFFPVGDAFYILPPSRLTPEQRSRAAILLVRQGYLGAAMAMLRPEYSEKEAIELLCSWKPTPRGTGLKELARSLCPQLLARAWRRLR